MATTAPILAARADLASLYEQAAKLLSPVDLRVFLIHQSAWLKAIKTEKDGLDYVSRAQHALSLLLANRHLDPKVWVKETLAWYATVTKTAD